MYPLEEERLQDLLGLERLALCPPEEGVSASLPSLHRVHGFFRGLPMTLPGLDMVKG